jgi:hypothetical protein
MLYVSIIIERSSLHLTTLDHFMRVAIIIAVGCLVSLFYSYIFKPAQHQC